MNNLEVCKKIFSYFKDHEIQIINDDAVIYMIKIIDKTSSYLKIYCKYFYKTDTLLIWPADFFGPMVLDKYLKASSDLDLKKFLFYHSNFLI